MTSIVAMTLTVTGAEAFALSIRSLLEAAECVSCAIGDGGVGCGEVSDLVRIETGDIAASGAGIADGLQILPTDRYIELLTAIADKTDTHAVSFVHGWPILTVVSETSTVAEAVGESIPGGGGAA